MSCHGDTTFGQHSQCDINTAHDRKVGCNTIKYTKAFLYSDWLYFLWHGINTFISFLETIQLDNCKGSNAFSMVDARGRVYNYNSVEMLQEIKNQNKQPVKLGRNDF